MLLVVLWRLRYKLRLRDLAELFLERGFLFSHEAVRAWEERFAPLLAENLRAKRRGQGGARWHADETSLRVGGRWCSLDRAIDREGNLADARPSERRDRDAAQRCFAQALPTAGQAPERVTTAGHDAYPRAIRETLGQAVTHRTSRHNNNRIAQDQRALTQRYYPMRAFGSFASADRFCAGVEEQRQDFRAVRRSGERVSLAERRDRFRRRWATNLAELAAA